VNTDTSHFIYIPQLGNPLKEADIWLRYTVWKFDAAAGNGYEVILAFGEIPYVYETTEVSQSTVNEIAFLDGVGTPNVYTEWDATVKYNWNTISEFGAQSYATNQFMLWEWDQVIDSTDVDIKIGAT
jgi:hypothetical protein